MYIKGELSSIFGWDWLFDCCLVKGLIGFWWCVLDVGVWFFWGVLGVLGFFCEKGVLIGGCWFVLEVGVWLFWGVLGVLGFFCLKLEFFIIFCWVWNVLFFIELFCWFNLRLGLDILDMG